MNFSDVNKALVVYLKGIMSSSEDAQKKVIDYFEDEYSIKYIRNQAREYEKYEAHSIKTKDEEKLVVEQSKKYAKTYYNNYGKENAKKHANEYAQKLMHKVMEVIATIDELIPRKHMRISLEEIDKVFNKLFETYPGLSSTAFECLHMYVLGNACKDHGLQDAHKFKDKLIACCNAFREFFDIKRNIFRSIAGDVALARIPSFKILKNRFTRAEIQFNAGANLKDENIRVRKCIKELRGKKRINIDQYLHLRNFIAWINDAEETDEIVLTYTSQHGIKRLEILVDIVRKINQMWRGQKNTNYKDKKDFIKHVVDFDAFSHDKHLNDEHNLLQVCIELSAIAQNMRNGLFPGIYSIDSINDLRLFFCVDGKNITRDRLNSTFKKMLPDTTVPFYSLIGSSQEQSFRDSSPDRHISDILSEQQSAIIESTVKSLAKERGDFAQENMITSICIMIYKNYKGLRWSKTPKSMPKSTCLRWYKLCKSIGIIEALRSALQGELIDERSISDFIS